MIYAHSSPRRRGISEKWENEILSNLPEVEQGSLAEVQHTGAS